MATAALGLWGLDILIVIDLASFLIAFAVLLFFIPIPKIQSEEKSERVLILIFNEKL